MQLWATEAIESTVPDTEPSNQPRVQLEVELKSLPSCDNVIGVDRLDEGCFERSAHCNEASGGATLTDFGHPVGDGFGIALRGCRQCGGTA